MSATFSDTDHGYRAWLKRMRSQAARMELGVFDEAAHSDGSATVAEIASYHELGLGVPRRSFIVDWLDENESWIKGRLLATAKALATGEIKTLAEGIDKLGDECVESIRDRIRAGIGPPLAESTVQAKGHDTPLIDTEQLIDAIEYRLENE